MVLYSSLDSLRETTITITETTLIFKNPEMDQEKKNTQFFLEKRNFGLAKHYDRHRHRSDYRGNTVADKIDQLQNLQCKYGDECPALHSRGRGGGRGLSGSCASESKATEGVFLVARMGPLIQVYASMIS